MIERLVDVAIEYRRMGLSVVPVGLEKRSDGAWKEYQRRLMTESEILTAFSQRSVRGIAVVCGAVSGGFEGLDLDAKNDLSGTLIATFIDRLQYAAPRLSETLVQAFTRNKGYHYYYRCPLIAPPLLLARRPATPEELFVEPEDPIKTLIETRANSQYILVPPSPGYAFENLDMMALSTISVPEREQLHEIAQHFNGLPVSRISRPVSKMQGNREGSPLDDYNNRGEVIGLLVKFGWVIVAETRDKTIFRRPGKTKQWSSGDYDYNWRLFTVFTTSTKFLPKTGYSPAAVFALLECGGNFTMAAKELLKLGFGVPYKFQQQYYFSSKK